MAQENLGGDGGEAGGGAAGLSPIRTVGADIPASGASPHEMRTRLEG